MQVAVEALHKETQTLAKFSVAAQTEIVGVDKSLVQEQPPKEQSLQVETLRLSTKKEVFKGRPNSRQVI